MAALDDTRLGAIVSAQIQLAKSHDSREREEDRSKALDYFLGTAESMAKYIPPEQNRSKVVSRDTADTIGWMLPGIMRVFTASDRMAEAEPVGQEDIEFAQQATDGMNYVFWKDNRGYQVVYNATWDALLTGNGVVKTWYDDTPVYTTSFHSGLSEDQLAALLMEDSTGEAPEVLAQSSEIVIETDPETGMTVQAESYEVKIKRKKADGVFVIEAIPPERFLIDEDAITTEDAAFTAHWERKSRSELIQMGYDRKTVLEIPMATRNETPEEASRRAAMAPTDSADTSTELVDYYECFLQIDADDDGEAELVRACYAGGDTGKLLHWEVWEDENPFDDIPCEPIPHRWNARSVFDETQDVQDIKTVLIRQALNNVYATNNPQRFAKGKIKNMDELLSPTFGGVVIGETGAEVTDLTVPFVANHAFEAIAYQDEVVQRRTGVSRQGMALDPETLQNQTATASRQQHDASYSQVEQIARNMAEWGWKKVFRKLLRLMIKHQGPRSLMVNGKAVDIDPRHWNADMDVTINVGLGTGSRDRDLLMLGRILDTQIGLADRFMQTGAFDEAVDMLPKIIRTMTKMAESAGIRNPEDYYPEYTDEKVQQLKQIAAERSQQPPPELQKAQMQIAADAEKGKAQMALEDQKAAVQARVKQMEAEANERLETQRMDKEFALKQYQMDREFQLKTAQLDAELALKERLAVREMEMKRELGFYNADTKAQVASSKTSGVHMGGDPG
ncbi:hypothetical protein [Mesorhizobium sp. Z1-4]|uniref:portal protein n=1 Tax=Mesorhizobium sp. Z1-4 TaxID=2448478 RepID=UPI000FD80E9E|nr:hypothetical protein [Mesorhizobium sp. Z1-4]